MMPQAAVFMPHPSQSGWLKCPVGGCFAIAWWSPPLFLDLDAGTICCAEGHTVELG